MERLAVRVKSTVYLAENILSYEFESVDQTALPEFTAGAHIDLHVDKVPVRSYSLYNNFDETKTYKVAIQRDEASRGGSVGFHNQLRAGQIIEVSKPRNNFEFKGEQKNIVFIAGGIGITPILSMIEKITHPQWKLYYYSRSLERCAFAKYLKEKFNDHVEIILNTDENLKSIDSIFEQHNDKQATEFYCCGPKGMIDAFKKFEEEFPYCYHESFVPEHEVSTENTYQVELRKSNKMIEVLQGQTLLDALLENDCDVMHSCREGICGACEVSVLEGIVDHRDSILTEEERLENKTIFPCCSSAKGKFLVLDI